MASSLVYWIHIEGGTEVNAFGPFTGEHADRFRAIYADDPRPDGSYKDIDDIPELPGVGDRDDHESSAWIRLDVHAERFGSVKVNDVEAIALRPTQAFELV